MKYRKSLSGGSLDMKAIISAADGAGLVPAITKCLAQCTLSVAVEVLASKTKAL